MATWVYMETERFEGNVLYTVGFYGPDGLWHSDSDHGDREEAARRTAWLNGSSLHSPVLTRSATADDPFVASSCELP